MVMVGGSNRLVYHLLIPPFLHAFLQPSLLLPPSLPLFLLPYLPSVLPPYVLFSLQPSFPPFPPSLLLYSSLPPSLPYITPFLAPYQPGSHVHVLFSSCLLNLSSLTFPPSCDVSRLSPRFDWFFLQSFDWTFSSALLPPLPLPGPPLLLATSSPPPVVGLRAGACPPAC